LPVDYGEQVIENTLSMLGTITSTEALVQHWA
jgi:hypothetical protein